MQTHILYYKDNIIYVTPFIVISFQSETRRRPQCSGCSWANGPMRTVLNQTIYVYVFGLFVQVQSKLTLSFTLIKQRRLDVKFTIPKFESGLWFSLVSTYYYTIRFSVLIFSNFVFNIECGIVSSNDSNINNVKRTDLVVN